MSTADGGMFLVLLIVNRNLNCPFMEVVAGNATDYDLPSRFNPFRQFYAGSAAQQPADARPL
jgi:hypothetical protein